MRIAEMLQAMANWLESPNNEALQLAEDHEDCMKVVAESCVLAAALLKQAAEEVEALEPPKPSLLTPENIEDIAATANAFDASGDPELRKQASVLDELLLTIAAPPNATAESRFKEDYRIEELRKKYEKPREELHAMDKISDSLKGIDKSKMTKQFKILEAPLSSRYCPDHPGSQISRIGEHIWQCELDKKTYNYESGFELENGDKVPGGDVAQQTQSVSTPFHAIFDTREGRLGYNRVAGEQNDLVKTAEPDEADLLATVTKSSKWRHASKTDKLKILEHLKHLVDAEAVPEVPVEESGDLPLGDTTVVIPAVE